MIINGFTKNGEGGLVVAYDGCSNSGYNGFKVVNTCPQWSIKNTNGRWLLMRVVDE